MGSTLMRLATERYRSLSDRTSGLPNGSPLDNDQLAKIMFAASGLPPEKRGVFLERVGARLGLRGSQLTDSNLDNAIQIALQGLVHNSAA